MPLSSRVASLAMGQSMIAPLGNQWLPHCQWHNPADFDKIITYFTITNKVNPVYPSSNFVERGYKYNKAQIVSIFQRTLTHWGRVMHICVSKLTIIGSDNGLLPDRRQAIIWTNAMILFIEPLGTNCSEILIEIHIYSFKKMHLKMSSRKLRPFCLGLNVLTEGTFVRFHLMSPPSSQCSSCPPVCLSVPSWAVNGPWKWAPAGVTDSLTSLW